MTLVGGLIAQLYCDIGGRGLIAQLYYEIGGSAVIAQLYYFIERRVDCAAILQDLCKCG